MATTETPAEAATNDAEKEAVAKEEKENLSGDEEKLEEEKLEEKNLGLEEAEDADETAPASNDDESAAEGAETKTCQDDDDDDDDNDDEEVPDEQKVAPDHGETPSEGDQRNHLPDSAAVVREEDMKNLAPASPAPAARSPRKLKFKSAPKQEADDTSQVLPAALPAVPSTTGPASSSHQKCKIQMVSCEDIGTRAFADKVLQSHLWIYHGVGRAPGQPSRVLVVTGQRHDPIERQSIASAVLHTALHAGAIVIEDGGDDSLFFGMTGLPKVLPDIIGVSPAPGNASVPKSGCCEAHRVTLGLSPCESADEERFAQAKADLAKNLAQGNKIVVLDAGTDAGNGSAACVGMAHRCGWPVLTLADGPQPSEDALWAAFTSTAYCHEAELASFLHLHLTVNLF